MAAEQGGLTGEFSTDYTAALRRYLRTGAEAELQAAHDLGRRALQRQVSILEVVEQHTRVLEQQGADARAALPFLLQTLAALDVAVRGYAEGARRYEQQRARAESLQDRDTFRTALVNALQEGFFVAGADGTVVEINDAFAEITGYGPDGLPYRWPHPWLPDPDRLRDRLGAGAEAGRAQAELQIRHRNGHLAWVAVSMSAVAGDGRTFVGTLRDITAARKAAARDSALMRLATAAGVATSVGEVLAIALEECRTAIDARRLVAVSWPDGDAEPVLQVVGEPADRPDFDEPLRAVLRRARDWPPLTVAPVPAADDPGASRGVVAVLSGTPVTVLWLEHRVPRPVSTDGRRLLAALVGHLSLAVQHVRHFETAREASLTLQRAMLPGDRPPPGFAVRYEPAVPPLEVGGDWYDVLPLDDHRIGIIVGDCVGRGLPAAAVMGQLRSSARALLLTGEEPARLLEHLDTVAEHIPGAHCATVFLAVLDCRTGRLRYSNAGHVPAVLAAPGAPPVLLDASGSVPLGIRRRRGRPQSDVTLPAGAALLAYTDGLVERRGSAIDDGIAHAGRVLAALPGAAAETVAERVLAELAPPGGYDDDVAIVVYRHGPAPLHLDVPAVPERLADIRARLADWLCAAGVDQPLHGDVVLAVNEAATNSIEHAYRGRPPGRVRVDAEFDGTRLCLRVADTGAWQPPDPAPRARGRGLPMMRAVSAGVTVRSTADGTTVEMVFAVGAPGTEPAADSASLHT